MKTAAKVFSLGLLMMISAGFQTAHADHTNLECSYQNFRGVEQFSKEYDVDCWDKCEINFSKDGYKDVKVSVANKGTELILELQEKKEPRRSGAYRSVIFGKPALMECYGGSIVNEGGEKLSCRYCWID